jgi:hypothetical protein
MIPARRGIESNHMTASRTSRRETRRGSSGRARSRKAAARARKAPAKPVVKIGSKLAPPPQVMFRLCQPGWSVIVEKAPNAQGTRFVCPFCPLSHRVPGPVRGFRKMRRAQWIKLRRVEE